VHQDPELPIGPKFLRGIDLWSIWKDVRCPVLVLRGADSDVLTGEIVEEMQRRKRGVSVVEFVNVGHAPSLADSQQIQAVRDFLLAPDEI